MALLRMIGDFKRLVEGKLGALLVGRVNARVSYICTVVSGNVDKYR